MMSTKPVLHMSNSIKFLDKNASWFYFLRLMMYHKQFADAVSIHASLSQQSYEIAQSPTCLQTTDDNPQALQTGHHHRLHYTTVPPTNPLISGQPQSPLSPIGIPNLIPRTQFLFIVDNVNHST